MTANRNVAALTGALEPADMLKEAAVMVAALLADPFDRDARMEARTWLTAWLAAQPARSLTSTTPGAAAATTAKRGV
jgi:hypothetical protein